MSISAEAWARLLSAGGTHFYESGAVLLRQGDPATHVLALVDGRVRAFRTAHDGCVLVLAVRGPGEILGDIAVLGGDSRSATVIAVDRCETRIVPADRFLLLVRSLGLETQLFRHAMARILEGEAWRAELASLPAGPRLVRTLLRLTVPGPGGRPMSAWIRLNSARQPGFLAARSQPNWHACASRALSPRPAAGSSSLTCPACGPWPDLATATSDFRQSLPDAICIM